MRVNVGVTARVIAMLRCGCLCGGGGESGHVAVMVRVVVFVMVGLGSCYGDGGYFGDGLW
jgi:hypothetical protein